MTAFVQEPQPKGAIKLAGEDNFYRIWVGDYRIIYTINDDQLFILVMKVGHRRDVYRSNKKEFAATKCRCEA